MQFADTTCDTAGFQALCTLGHSLCSGSFSAKYHMMAPLSNTGRSPAVWSTRAGILHGKPSPQPMQQNTQHTQHILWVSASYGGVC